MNIWTTNAVMNFIVTYFFHSLFTTNYLGEAENFFSLFREMLI